MKLFHNTESAEKAIKAAGLQDYEYQIKRKHQRFYPVFQVDDKYEQQAVEAQGFVAEHERAPA